MVRSPYNGGHRCSPWLVFFVAQTIVEIDRDDARGPAELPRRSWRWKEKLKTLEAEFLSAARSASSPRERPSSSGLTGPLVVDRARIDSRESNASRRRSR